MKTVKDLIDYTFSNDPDHIEKLHATAMLEAKALLKDAINIVFFTGAGISAESGISTWRDPATGALWDKFDPDKMSTMKGFEENPKLVWDWYDSLYDRMYKASPNFAHWLIGTISHEPNLQVTVITQNIDNLHERAGSKNVIHLHGEAGVVKCTHCDFKGMVSELKRDEGFVPACPKCGSMARPDVVWFGEMLPKMPFLEAKEAILAADVVVVVGTSGQVEPAASLPGYAFGKVISVNTRKSDHTFSWTIDLTGKASTILEELFS